MHVFALPDLAELDELGASTDGLSEPIRSRVTDAGRDDWTLLAEWRELVDSYETEG